MALLNIYTSNQDLIISTATIVDILTIGGGGGGAVDGGGGGGGGFLFSSGILQPGTYHIIVGTGGVKGSLSAPPTSGEESYLLKDSDVHTKYYLAKGGGAGGQRRGGLPYNTGLEGGSGGGSAGAIRNASPYTGRAVLINGNYQGNDGGMSYDGGWAGLSGGGGGGASSAGSNSYITNEGSSTVGYGGNGGNGKTITIAGQSFSFSGGGGGCGAVFGGYNITPGVDGQNANSYGGGGRSVTNVFGETYDNTDGNAGIVVISFPPTSITVTPNPALVHLGKTIQLTAIGKWPDNSTQDITTLCSWSSSDPSKATIDLSTGLATAIAVGQTTITASWASAGGVSGSTNLTVSNKTLKWGNGTAVDIVASGNYTLTDENGNTITATVDYNDLPSADAEDDIYVLIGRTYRAIERMKPRAFSDIKDGFFVDCGLTYDGRNDSNPQYASSFTGLNHLEGQEVAIIADGVVLENQTVKNGRITIAKPALVVHIGLPYVSDFETLNLASPRADITDKRKLINAVSLIVDQSKDFKVGPDEDNLQDYKLNSVESYDPDTLLVDGEVDVGITAGWEKKGRIFVRQEKASPVAILAVIPQVKVGGS